MNKKLKIASAAVAVVMAGSMAFGMFGCGNSNNPDKKPGNTGTESAQFEGTDANSAKIKGAVSSELKYADYVGLCNTAYDRLLSKAWVNEEGNAVQTKKTVATSVNSAVNLRFNVGDKPTRSIEYAGLITGTITLPNGDRATDGDLKPVWSDILEAMNEKTPGNGAITFEDKYFKDSGKLKAIKDDEAKKLSDYDIITDGVTNVALYQTELLDLSLYMDEMPNYSAFLEANPTVKDSLTFNGGSMYYAPYFDGYNDVEKYSLFKNNWVKALLDATAGDTTQTWAASMTAKEKNGTKASIQSYMGKTGSWTTEVLDKDGKAISAGITVNYDKALQAAKGTSGLGAAVSAAAGKTYDGTSGNIVDIMNFVIDTKEGAVTGAQLLSIMQEYIKVAYYLGGTETPFYTQAGYKLSDVFAGNSAAWDVDLFAALGRVMITNPTLLKSGSATVGSAGATPLKDVYLVTPREQNMQRGSDVISWIGELYGIRGLESRYGYSYISDANRILDARGNENSYRAAKAFNAFYYEGLVFPASEKPSNGKNGVNTYYSLNTVEAMAMHDYLNTQTPAGFKVSGDTNQAVYDGVEDGYDFTANITAVSKWDEDGNKKIESDEYFRFTESWRSVKDSGICVPLASVENDPAKLKTVLTFIDYIFSEDGQIMMAYGAPATSAEGNGGFWYNPEVTTETIAADGSVTIGGVEYKGTFTFGGKKYASNTYYGKRYNPTLTKKTLDAYTAKDVNGYKYDGTKGSSATEASDWKTSCVMSYTDFARFVMGSALNFGNKLTSLEYQMTSQMGKAGAEKIDIALGDDGVIRHVTPALAEGQSKWYAIAPTSLPFTKEETKADGTLAKDCVDLYQKGTQDTIFTIHKTSATNLYYEIVKKGYDFAAYAGTFSKLGLNK